MRTFLFSAILTCLLLVSGQAQTVLTGFVKDAETGETLIGATVIASQGGQTVRAGVTNHEGEYRFSLDPGTYDVEVRHTGYQVSLTTGVVVRAGKINDFNVVMSGAAVLSEVVVTEYKVPLIRKDETSGGQTLTSESIRPLPSGRSKSKKAEKKAAKAALDSGNANIKGSRGQATNYYVDGVRVSGKAVPAGEVSDLEKPRYGIADSTITPEESNREQYDQIRENQFVKAKETAVSTFSIDVDAASYANVRRFIENGNLPPRDAVRIEEMINYFDYQYKKPSGEHPFEALTELGICPWNPENRLLMIALQGQEMDLGQLPPSNFVFLVDVSGSMSDWNKLPLVKQSLELLTDQLRPEDRVALVAYAGAAGLVLPSTSGRDKVAIKNAIQNLSSGGSTAGGAGIQLAYKIARENLAQGGNNRVVLCTDGDFNVGVSSGQGLEQLIEKERESGVYLTVLGYGMGNYQDGKMQTLADKGNGNHAYIDDLDEAKKVLVREFGGTMYAIAKDVKLQLEFNPEAVESYRLIGYENRLLAKEDFDDDKKDAGELGLGHRVTALYEIVPRHDDRLYKHLMKLKFRYKQPKGSRGSQLIERTVAEVPGIETSENFKLAAAVAEFGLLLRDSKFKGKATWEHALASAKTAALNDPNGYRAELVRLISEASTLAGTAARK